MLRGSGRSPTRFRMRLSNRHSTPGSRASPPPAGVHKGKCENRHATLVPRREGLGSWRHSRSDSPQHGSVSKFPRPQAPVGLAWAVLRVECRDNRGLGGVGSIGSPGSKASSSCRRYSQVSPVSQLLPAENPVIEIALSNLWSRDCLARLVLTRKRCHCRSSTRISPIRARSSSPDGIAVSRSFSLRHGASSTLGRVTCLQLTVTSKTTLWAASFRRSATLDHAGTLRARIDNKAYVLRARPPRTDRREDRPGGAAPARMRQTFAALLGRQSSGPNRTDFGRRSIP
jgi:hypothetical protein